MGASSKSRRDRWNEVCKKTKNCPHCPPHKVENAGRQPKQDRYKDKRNADK